MQQSVTVTCYGMWEILGSSVPKMSFLVWLPKNVSSRELEEQRSEGVDLGVSYENLTSDPITEVKGKLMFVFA